MMNRNLLACVAVFAMFAVFFPPADASGKVKKQKTALEWAWDEPVTLLDLGMLRLRQDIHQAGTLLYEMGEVAGQPLSGVYYDWRHKKIEAFLTVRAKPGLPRPDRCEQLFFRVISDVVSGGTNSFKKPSWYIENLFTHEPLPGSGRPQNFAEQLLDAVNFEITIMPAGSVWEEPTIRCGGRLDAEPGTIVASEQ